MWILHQSVSGIPSSNVVPSSLPLVAKVLGFVVSWAASIYFLWVRKPPKVLSNLPFFEQTQRVSIIVTSIFLMLTWGALGTSQSLKILIILAIGLTTAGIVVYFLTIAWTTEKEKAPSAIKTVSSLNLLILFLIYTAFISCGLTSAGVFLTVLLTNPANAALGTSLTKPEALTITLTVVGKIVTAENQDTPFAISSGQANFGCEEGRPYHVEFNIPSGATLVGQPTASFLSVDNAKLQQPPSVVTSASTVSTSGILRGLDYQNFAFARNCPGGGHGELVLSGVYRSTVNHEQEVTRVFTNELSTATNAPVWVTLPDLDISSIKAVCKRKSGSGSDFTVVVSPAQTSASDGPFQVTYVPEKKQVGLSFK